MTNKELQDSIDVLVRELRYQLLAFSTRLEYELCLRKLIDEQIRRAKLSDKFLL